MNFFWYFLLKFSKSKRFSFIIQIFFSISFRILTHLCISRAPHLPFSLWLRSRRIFFHTIFIKIFIDTISFIVQISLSLSTFYRDRNEFSSIFLLHARNYWNIEIMLVRNRIRQTAPATSSGKPVRPFFPSHFTFSTLDNSFYQFRIRNFGSDWKELASY